MFLSKERYKMYINNYKYLFDYKLLKGLMKIEI